MSTFKYFVYTNPKGEIEGVQFREPDGCIRKTMRSGRISSRELFALDKQLYKEISKEDMDRVLRLVDKGQDVDQIETDLIAITKSV